MTARWVGYSTDTTDCTSKSRLTRPFYPWQKYVATFVRISHVSSSKPVRSFQNFFFIYFFNLLFQSGILLNYSPKKRLQPIQIKLSYWYQSKEEFIRVIYEHSETKNVKSNCSNDGLKFAVKKSYFWVKPAIETVIFHVWGTKLSEYLATLWPDSVFRRNFKNRFFDSMWHDRKICSPANLGLRSLFLWNVPC